MTRDEFLKAKAYIFSDVEREIQLARAVGAALQALGVTPGGGNFLAALGPFATRSLAARFGSLSSVQMAAT